MHCVVAFLVFVTLIVLAGFGQGGTRRTMRRPKAYNLLAARYRGNVHRTGWFGYPRVLFQYRSMGVLVGVFPHGVQPGERGPWTLIQIACPNVHFFWSMAHPPRPPQSTARDGLFPWQSGQPEFDQRFSGRTSNPGLMSGMMNEVVRRRIDRLRGISRTGRLLVELHRGTLRISKSPAIYGAAELLEFVRESLVLYDQILLSTTEGIEFLDSHDAQPLDHVVCQICGEEITGNLVYCSRCKTPHHRECWLYAGRCSVFGCGEIQFLVPHRAARLERRPPDDGATG